ncbi:uncharacterized protein LOC128392284 [Panonychus citri]|uniref:uncharacterized protein LOC128392284 n=1 Tax=Panonychus citri TaxID=50023 RepID=UPI0023082914|nr:uncharacterized protein LOC128392284 [Panonychus citri]
MLLFNCYTILIVTIVSSDAFFIKNAFKAYDLYTKDLEQDFTSIVINYVNETKPWLAPCAINFIKKHPKAFDLSPHKGDEVVYLDYTLLDIASEIFKRSKSSPLEKLLC